MKTPLSKPVLAFIFVLSICTAAFAKPQGDPLEDHPYKPSDSVEKGTALALTDASGEVVKLAIRRLGGWRDTGSAPQIAKFLAADTSPEIRVESLNYFIRLGAQARPFVPEIIKHLADGDPNIRMAALSAVFAATASAENVDAIKPLIEDSRADVQSAAAICLGQAGKTAAGSHKALMDALAKSGNTEFRVAAMHALGEIGSLSADDLGIIMALLSDEDAEVRIAAWSLAAKEFSAAKQGGTTAADKLDAIRKQLAGEFFQEPPEIKAAMIESAGKYKDVVEASDTMLVKQIKTGEPETKAAALRVLGKAGEPALAYLDLIVEQAGDRDPEIRAAALAALGSLGPAAVKPNLKLVAGALLDGSDLVRREALEALPAAGSGLRAFPYRLKDVFPKVSPGVRTTLVKALPVIIQAIDADDDITAREHDAFTDPDPEIRIAMAYAVTQVDSEKSRPLLPDLLTLLKDKDAAVRGAAALSLRVFTTDATTITQLRASLRPLLKDHEAEVRWAALDTFCELDPAGDPALVTEIAGLMKDEDESVRSSAVHALGAAGAAAKPFLTGIIHFFEDDPAVPPFDAAEAVLKISPLTPQEMTSLLQPVYDYPELQPLVRLTAYGASGGDRDALLIVRLLGKSGIPASQAVEKTEINHAIDLLQDSLKAPLVNDTMRNEINARISGLKALP